VDPAGRRVFGVAAGFVSVAGFVWLALAVLLVVVADGTSRDLAREVLRVGGPPGVVAVVAGLVSLWARR
jgi:hypothetical protein